MIGYDAFAELSLSSDSDERGHAAHMAALAYLGHQGPADEQAALYAALVGFLDDTSVKVRAALAYGLLHSGQAPRPVMLALLQDSAIISRAVLQYSPVLVDADLLPIVARGDASLLLAISQRVRLSTKLAAALVARGDRDLVLRVLRRSEVALDARSLDALAGQWGEDGELRGALLNRADLPGMTRLNLVRKVVASLSQSRIVRGALAPERLARIVRDGSETALAAIGEAETPAARVSYVDHLVEENQIHTRLLLHAVVTGRVVFFATCLGRLAGVNDQKVFSLLESGSSASLAALFDRCGLSGPCGRLLLRLVMLARSADLADDVAARHYVVTVLTEELIADYDGDIPETLEEAFCYLNEQNIVLARKAARGVMASFARPSEATRQLPIPAPEQQPRLSAA